MERLNDAQGVLASDYYDYAMRLAKPYKKKFPGLASEIESAAGYGLVMAARRFDPEKNVKFSTFARPRIVGAIRTVFRDLPKTRPTSIHGLENSVGANQDGVPEFEDMLSVLPNHQSKLLRYVYGRGLDIASAGRRVGLSFYESSEAHRAALKSLRAITS